MAVVSYLAIGSLNKIHRQAEGVKPTLSELERFEEAPEGMDIDLTSADKDDIAHAFSNGDNVEVNEGELINLQGKVIAVDGSKITILPKHTDLKDPLEFQASELKKYFCQGCMATEI